jgi:hypothetical protein
MAEMTEQELREWVTISGPPPEGTSSAVVLRLLDEVARLRREKAEALAAFTGAGLDAQPPVHPDLYTGDESWQVIGPAQPERDALGCEMIPDSTFKSAGLGAQPETRSDGNAVPMKPAGESCRLCEGTGMMGSITCICGTGKVPVVPRRDEEDTACQRDVCRPKGIMSQAEIDALLSATEDDPCDGCHDGICDRGCPDAPNPQLSESEAWEAVAAENCALRERAAVLKTAVSDQRLINRAARLHMGTLDSRIEALEQRLGDDAAYPYNAIRNCEQHIDALELDVLQTVHEHHVRSLADHVRRIERLEQTIRLTQVDDERLVRLECRMSEMEQSAQGDRRLDVAAQLMAALISDPTRDGRFEQYAEWALAGADALIAAAKEGV